MRTKTTDAPTLTTQLLIVRFHPLIKPVRRTHSASGANWFGSEGRSGPPLGLDKHHIGWYMQFLKDNHFNAIRLLFNHKTILDDMTLEPPDEVKYGKGAPWEAPELQNFKYIDMFKRLAEVAADYGILIMIACHRLNPQAW